MKLAIITHVPHKYVSENIYAAYAPYVREMNLWLKYVDSVEIVAPFSKTTAGKIDISYTKKVSLVEVHEINLTKLKSIVESFFYLPSILYKIFVTTSKADHVHLRCPGNIGLLGCIAQIFFPGKKKSAKYAGNWDKNSKQPWSYKLQKWILNNEFLTRNMQVMVYGSWQESSKNVVPFFTASYSENLRLPLRDRCFGNEIIKLIFVGAINEGKRPLLSIQIAEELLREGINVQLDIFGNGEQMVELNNYISAKHLSSNITMHGNQSAEEVIEYYQRAHFLIFLSKSEGWPKVVAESMWWGCLPITTAVSCVPEMLGNETRGSLILPDLQTATSTIRYYINNPGIYSEKIIAASDWSRQFTIEKFEKAISELIV